MEEEGLIEGPEEIEWADCECCKIHDNILLVITKCCANRNIYVGLWVVIAIIILAAWIGGAMMLGMYGDGKDGFIKYAWIIWFMSPLILFALGMFGYMVYECIKMCCGDGMPRGIQIV